MRAILLVLVLGAGCFKVSQPPCAYSCGPGGECPDDYQCGTDNYCHLHGTGVCEYSDGGVTYDLSTPATPDMSFPPEPMDFGPLPTDL